jgi:hypothetical protein
VVALATLARITSCFPAAFAPVVVPARGDTPSRADAKLRMWGRLDDGKSYCFLDGGILDNKPFTSTLRTIFYRTADRPVRRHVLYVEPDPERFGEESARFRVPSFTESAVDSLTKLPGYESIADDLRLVGEHNDKVDRLARLRAAVVENGGVPSEAQRDLWRKARLSALRDAMLRRMLGVESGERLSDDLAVRARELRDHFDRHYTESVQESAFLLTDFDVEFRLRRLFHLTYSLDDDGALGAINREIEFLEIVRHALEEALVRSTEARGTAAPGETWKAAFRRLTVLFRLDASDRPFPRPRPEEDPKRELTDEELALARNELDRRLSALTADAAPEGNNVFEVSDSYELALARAFGPAVEKAYTDYEGLDAWLFPLEFVADLHERDVIRVTRLSPIDARRGLCQRALEDKLCGDTLSHFGAFFKRSWRSNDILWGRLDGVCQLVETVGERSFIVDTLATDRRRTILGCERQTPAAERAERILEWLEKNDVFPCAVRSLRRTIAERLARLLNVKFAEGASETQTAAALVAELEKTWSPLVDDLVRASHLDILDEELPKVVEDAAFEQMHWNQIATSGAKVLAPLPIQSSAPVFFDAGTQTFQSSRASFDPLVLALASKELATEALNRLRNRDDPLALETFFRTYRVGSETFEDLPRIVLLELGARAALVAQNCLVDSFPRPAGIRQHWLFRLCLDWPLRVFDATARFLRYAPGARRPFVMATIAYVALAVVVNALWMRSLYVQDGLQRQIALLLFVIGPFVFAVSSWLLVRPFRSPRATALGTSIGAILGLSAIAATLWVTLRLFATDLAPICASSPFSGLGEHCAPVLRGAILLLPLVVGFVVGAFARAGAPQKRAPMPRL